MLIKILLIVAIVIQTIATLFAIRLIRTTKYNSIWILFTFDQYVDRRDVCP